MGYEKSDCSMKCGIIGSAGCRIREWRIAMAEHFRCSQILPSSFPVWLPQLFSHKCLSHLSELTAPPISTIRLGEKGAVTVPAAHRKKHKLSKGSAIVVLQLGEALMLVLADPSFDRLCQRLQDILTGEGISTKQALKNLEKIRREHFQELYGKEQSSRLASLLKHPTPYSAGSKADRLKNCDASNISAKPHNPGLI